MGALDWDRRPVPGTFSPAYPWYGLGALKLDPAGDPVLEVYDPVQSSKAAVDLVRWDGASWSWETVADVGFGVIAMDFDAAGDPVLVYADTSNSRMVVARFDGSAWSFTDGPPLGSNPGVWAALRLTRAGDSLIAYL